MLLEFPWLRECQQTLAESYEKIQIQASELLELSRRDPLTQLYNRRHFDEQATNLHALATRAARPLSLMLADIDHFKLINDRLSHQTGDVVLRQVAEILRDNTRGSDLVARYGGEEFIIVFPETSLAAAEILCNKLRQQIADYPWHALHPDLSVTISMGLASATPEHALTGLISVADEQLYRAKASGRNCVCKA